MGCKGCVCGICGIISGLLIAIAGVVFLLFGLGMMTDVGQVHLISGALLLLYGLSVLIHAMNLCPMCKDDKCCK